MRSKKRTICSYHDCKKQGTAKCNLCNDMFCQEHFSGRIAGMLDHRNTSFEYKKFVEEYRKPGGHPCPEYLDHLKNELLKEKEKYYDALDRLIDGEYVNKHYMKQPMPEEFKLLKFINFGGGGDDSPKPSKQDYGFQEINLGPDSFWKFPMTMLICGLFFYYLYPFGPVLIGLLGALAGLGVGRIWKEW